MRKIVRLRVHDKPMRLDGQRTRDQGPPVKAEIARFKGAAFSAESDDEGVTVYHTAEGLDPGRVYPGVGPGQLPVVEDLRGDQPLDGYARVGGPSERITGEEFGRLAQDRSRMSFGDLARAERDATGKVLASINDRNRAFWASRGGRA